MFEVVYFIGWFGELSKGVVLRVMLRVLFNLFFTDLEFIVIGVSVYRIGRIRERWKCWGFIFIEFY